MKKKIQDNYSALSDMKQRIIGRMLRYRIEDEIKTLSMFPGISCIANAEGLLVWASQSFCDQTGWTEDELTNIKFIHFIHPEDIQKTNMEYSEQLGGHEIEEFMNRWRCKDGHYLTLKWRATKLSDEGFIMANAIVQ